jgi:predicted metal-dependent phosphoesterase TrpH
MKRKIGSSKTVPLKAAAGLKPNQTGWIAGTPRNPFRSASYSNTMNQSHRIVFEKPNLSDLSLHYTVVDLHFHSHYSDGNNSIVEIADRAAELGIGIAITDHNEIRGAVEIDRYRDVLSIPGIELTSREGTHLLIYFYDINSLKRFYREDVTPFMGVEVMSSTSLSVEEIVARARKFKALAVLPHPYCGTYTGIYNSFFPEERLNRVYAMIDGVEVINSENLKKGNLRSALLGFNLNKGITGGSDGHRLSQMGRVVCCAPCKPNRKAVLDAIVRKKNRVIGKEIDILHKVTSNGSKLKTNLRNYPDLVEKNLRFGYTVINTRSRQLRDNVRRSLMERRKRINGHLKVSTSAE